LATIRKAIVRIAWNDQSQRTFARVEALAITKISQQKHPNTEGGVEFCQGKEHRITVRCASYHSQGHIRPFQLPAQWSTNPHVESPQLALLHR